VKLAVVTPTRGDRPNFIGQWRYLLSRQTRTPDIVELVDEPVVSSTVDLVKRFRLGIDRAAAKGADAVVFMEDDDWYSQTYLEEFEKILNSTKCPVVGSDLTIYYHIIAGKYAQMAHPGRASMMYTAVRPDGIKDFPWPPPDGWQLDIKLWRWAAETKKGFTFRPTPLQAIGIKHGEGLRISRSHTLPLDKSAKGWLIDSGQSWLRSHIDATSFFFYSEQRKNHGIR
jgi:hypothetical protein